MFFEFRNLGRFKEDLDIGSWRGEGDGGKRVSM